MRVLLAAPRRQVHTRQGAEVKARPRQKPFAFDLQEQETEPLQGHRTAALTLSSAEEEQMSWWSRQWQGVPERGLQQPWRWWTPVNSVPRMTKEEGGPTCARLLQAHN